ncbi:uncharacterized protein [Drosophila pseudoobscura]|uniref:Titin n=1 Tax=Drosophila pseudoobscura pseudoobscura TaxID=46245 RepID=A0A6I8UYE7_DROPS|nr:uncharacterized protein LOC6903119 [Drosophila pseudoobscura]
MEKNKRRSSLRQPPARDDDQTAAAGTQNCVLKRRISFSGKKSVREFVNTEEPHYWEDSYELSDCTNGEDNSREKASKAGPSQQAPTADKENIPLQFEHASTRIDMTLNLRTSIDVPMFPCEKNRNRPNCSVPRESLFAESFSLSSMGRDKLKDTLYSHRITDKTIDLMQISSKVREDCSFELSSFEMEHMKTQPTKSVGDSFMDITPLGYTGPVTPAAAAVPVPAEKENVDPVQKLVHMEVEEGQKEIQRQEDISFDCDMNDSDARDRLPSHGFFQTEPNNSTINYLGDESVLIPFDMISGENISKKLNFRQLNDDLEAGKIKVFANGPRTPCTDRKAKQKRFWHGLDEDQDQDPMDINIRSIKPRATLNFSENMTMSPLAQTAPVTVAAVAEPLPREKLKIPDDKRKYRVSQADEMMLDNTNFLAHAKLGDETQSRNSSKVLSRRESTYESSELDLGTPKRNSSCRQDFQPSTMQEAPSKHSKPRQTIHMPVEMEQDMFRLEEAAAAAIPPGRTSSSARLTISQNESMDQGNIVDEKATAIQFEDNVPRKRTISKRRETLLMEESMEEDIISPLKELHLKGNAHPAKEPKSRHTLHLAEPLEEDEALPRNAAATEAIRKDRRHLAEAVQEHLQMGNQRSKARQSILQEEPIEEDVDNAATGAIRNEAVQQNLPMGNQRSKARQTILQAEPIEEDVTATGAIKNKSVQKHVPIGNQRSKARQTILQSEAIVEDVDDAATGAVRKDYEHLAEAGQKHLPMGYQRSKARQTILQSEPIEEDVDNAATGAIRKEALQQNLPMGDQRPKARQTILQAEAIEEEFDYAATGAMRKDRKQLAESVQEHLPMTNQRSKASQTILQSEAIEEDFDGATGAIRNEALQQNLPMGNQRSKARQTILKAEPIEEEFDYAATGAIRKDYEHLAETVQEHHVPTGDRSSRSRQTLLTAVPIEEDHSMAYQSFKPRNTPESREESVAFKSRNTLMLAELIEENMTAVRTSKARQTLLLATSMEEEEQLREPPLEKSTKVAPKRGSRAEQTLIMSESMEEEEEHPKDSSFGKSANRGSRSQQTLIMSESMEEEAEKADDFQSPLQSTGAPPELLPITPMLKQNGSGSLNSMNEFEKFEEETNQAATPRGTLPKTSALLRKIRSMGESMRMSLEGDALGCGTPTRHSGDAKRLFAHLTPNQPEAKKRNTHLFGDMEMEQEMEASIAVKEVTAAVDMNFDLTLQPVRGLIGEHMSRPTVFEERPITVSDVSAYFKNLSCKVKKEPAEGTMEVERDTCPRDSGSSTDRSFKSYAPTNKRFINLSGDTTIFSAAIVETIDVDQQENNQIDNVRLSLVSTLADEPDTDEEAPVEDALALPKQPEPQPQPEPEPEHCQEQQESSRVVAAGSSASCRKCANCRRSLSEPRLSNDSFVLPTQPQWDMTREIEMLRRVRAKPNLDDVHKYWQIKEQERQTIALEKELDSSSEASEEEEFSEWDVNEVMATYKRKMERFKRSLADNQEVLQQMLVPLEPVDTFFDRLHDLLGEQQPNWIFDYQLKVSQKLIFTHRLLTTFRLIVDYETVDELETAIRVCAINVEQATVILPLQSWTAFEHLLDFQLQLKLPVNLTDSIEGSSVEAFAQFLQRINAICVDILRTFHKLLTVLTATRASLLRQANRIVVKKTVRRHIEVDTRTRLEKTDFVIEIANVEAISFRDILQPKLHFFNENIQFLPTGVAFLEAFLDHPEQYLKV